MSFVKQISKCISLLLIIGLNWAGISAVGSTWAYFNDTEMSEGNSMAAGVLDFTLDSESDFAPEANLGQDSERTIMVEDMASTMDYNYKVSVDNTDNIPVGDLCGYLYLKDNVSGALQQPLTSFVSSEVLYPDISDWTFTASLNVPLDSGWEGKTCAFDFIYEGWQDNIAFGAGGFSDVERISNVITAGQSGEHLLITKVYYDVCNKTNGSCGEYKGEEKNNEWVEIYNPTSADADIHGWKICDNNSCDTLPDSDVIPAYGFAIITDKNTTWDYWSIPDDVIKIELNNSIGGGLANTGDRVILKNADGEEVDAMSYEDDVMILNPAPPLDEHGATYDLPKGHMLGRMPVAQDTDTAADWQDLGLPIVNSVSVSPLQSEYCGNCGGGSNKYCAPGLYYSQQLDIAWNATTNNTSGNSELSVDIAYIADNDCSGDISDGDNRYVIKRGEINDGSYTWAGWTGSWNGTLWEDENGNIVPYFYGYEWIKITAAGPENFMVNNSKASIPMFEPLPTGIDFEDFCSMPENPCGGECHLGSEDYFETDDSVVNENSGDNASDDNIDAGIEEIGKLGNWKIGEEPADDIFQEGSDDTDTDNTIDDADSDDKDVISGDGDISDGAGDAINYTGADAGDAGDPISVDDASVNNTDNENGNNADNTDTAGDESGIIQTVSLKDEDSGGLGSDGENGDGNDGGGNSDSL